MIVQAEDVWKRFGRLDALRGLSFSVPEGSTFALIGANGAGKTTTIKVLMNIVEPTAGDATVLGVNTRNLSPSGTGADRVCLRKPGHAGRHDGVGIHRVFAAVLPELGSGAGGRNSRSASPAASAQDQGPFARHAPENGAGLCPALPPETPGTR